MLISVICARPGRSHAAPCLIGERSLNTSVAYGLHHLDFGHSCGKASAPITFNHLASEASGMVAMRADCA